MDSLPAMSLGKLEKNLDDWDSSSTFSHASFESQLKGFRLTFSCGRDGTIVTHNACLLFVGLLV